MDGRLLGGRYRLLEAHAMGGMASVWRAHDEMTGDTVAVKRLHPHLIADQGARERFRREAAAMEAIRHPNVVAVRDAVVDGDEPALVMDFVAGRSLAEMATDGHRFGEAEALAVAAATADGLAAVHERGIVHRDIKPANVLIGDDGVVRLSDFGIAVDVLDETALTADDGVVGTLRYLAPERLSGQPATPATDVWGVGTVLFEMLTGVDAFPATTLAARVDSASTPVERPDGLADATWAVLARALASDPLDRYATGAAMAADLHRLPGVPAALEVPADPSAPTEVITLPVAAAADSGSGTDDDLAAVPVVTAAVATAAAVPAEAPAPVEPSVDPPRRSPTPMASSATRARSPSRSALAMAGMLGVLTLALLVGMATASPGAADPSAAAGASATPAATPTAAPTPAAADEQPEDDPKPGKGNGKGKKGGD